MILGRHQHTTARPSLIVTGPAAAGKTTVLLNVGRTCHLAHTRKNPPRPGSAYAAVPVAYVLVPPGATAKTLITEFARYLGIPTTARMTQTQITEAVCHTYTQAGVHLVMIDEIHRLNLRTTTGAQTADLLKTLSERLPATFVYAGINVTDTPLFTGVRGAQLAGRATLVDCGPLPARHGKREPGPRLDAECEENNAFWTWASIEVLRRTGARIEELLELTHLSLRQYQAPTGETVPLLQVSPSKTDRERVIPADPRIWSRRSPGSFAASRAPASECRC